ncbi:hypothetical protein [Kibdelosporangium philippinense]|uniref:hypothetical protein n=1 Tax=Kibdelosporangium philippinense TaxID=211113 RepID=UPI003623761F
MPIDARWLENRSDSLVRASFGGCFDAGSLGFGGQVGRDVKARMFVPAHGGVSDCYSMILAPK